MGWIRTITLRVALGLFSLSASVGWSGEVRARAVVMPLYGSGARAVAVLRIGAIIKDHEKRAFFRIGFLPSVKMEGVAVALLTDKDQSARVLARLFARLNRLSEDGHWEVHGFQLAQGKETPFLVADELHPTGAGVWRMERVVIWISGQRISIPQALLDFSDGQGRALLRFGGYEVPISDLSVQMPPDKAKRL